MLSCGNRIRQGIPRHGEIAIEFTELFRWQEKGGEMKFTLNSNSSDAKGERGRNEIYQGRNFFPTECHKSYKRNIGKLFSLHIRRTIYLKSFSSLFVVFY